MLKKTLLSGLGVAVICASASAASLTGGGGRLFLCQFTKNSQKSTMSKPKMR
ncbi:Uncharacterised protein [Campylobacter hyointestinalis subsp. hyointestinalis]|uniref:Uncharacterized protein n=1 Tax=Campylobacter hyointestinalis subsp. hyointestinalis TaxID=91352 RepID=A0A9W5EZC2_CAMHY|nr:hypothetical protein [Campylobacter hyointestinalis]CUU77570.1 Uncharacterised protein [Campylobacter hyointestinalis subsp. hyointestinalis]